MTNSELWAKVIDLARTDVDSTAAFRQIRALGGRDIAKSDDDFKAIYKRFQKHPLFAAFFLLTEQQREFQHDVLDAMWALTPSDSAETVRYTNLMQEFEKGSGQALLTILGTVTVDRSTPLTVRAKALYPELYAVLESRPSAQLEFPGFDSPVEPERTPAVPEGV